MCLVRFRSLLAMALPVLLWAGTEAEVGRGGGGDSRAASLKVLLLLLLLLLSM